MSFPPSDSALSLPLPGVAATEGSPHASPLEEEVIGLFDQLRDRLLRYLHGFGLTAADAEEIVQEVFLALFEHLRRDKSRDNLRGWVFRVAHNLGLKRRAAARRSSGGIRLVPDTEGWFVDPAPNPEDQAVRAQRQRRIAAVLRALPDSDRHCLFLRAEGLRYREIAKVLDISLGAVAHSIARSLARLSRAAER